MNNTNITYLEKVIHEMNSPLQNLSMMPDLMLDSNVALSKADQREGMKHIQTSANKLIQLVGMLSSITNLSSDKLILDIVKTDLVTLISKAIHYHTTHITRGNSDQIEIIFNNKLKKCYVAIDKFWFEQVLTNLIINAINHMDRGIIKISLETIQKNGIAYTSLKVTDEGCGIPKDELQDIFKPLMRGSHSVGKVNGSGIGLAVTKEVVEAHDGSISAANHKNGGATFEVMLPVKA